MGRDGELDLKTAGILILPLSLTKFSLSESALSSGINSSDSSESLK
jgi:hypothetical protein